MDNKDLKKILYVDDEESNLILFQIMFKNKFNVIIANSGEKGLHAINNNDDIQLIISDMKMPIMDGLEFIAKVKERNNSIPCVLLSGYERTEKINEAIQGGIIMDYFMKPLNKNKIEEFIINL